MQYVLRRAERAHSQAGVGASLWPVEDFLASRGSGGEVVWQPVRSAGSNETSLEVACRGEVLDALVLTGEREQVAQMPNSRQEEQERRHES